MHVRSTKSITRAAMALARDLRRPKMTQLPGIGLYPFTFYLCTRESGNSKEKDRGRISYHDRSLAWKNAGNENIQGRIGKTKHTVYVKCITNQPYGNSKK
jgi:hypothetical protein